MSRPFPLIAPSPRGRRHLLFAGLLAAGLLLRVVAQLGFRPALWFNDSFEYYSRVIVFADCAKVDPPPRLRPLCEAKPVGKRWKVGSDYIWWDGPLDRMPLSRKASVEVPEDRFDPARNEAAREFAVLALRAQPGDYLRWVARDVARGFRWERDVYPHPNVHNMYEFSERSHSPPAGRVFVSGAAWELDVRAYAHGDARTKPVQPYADWMIWYQKHVRIPGPALLALFVVAFAGIAVRRARDERRLSAGLLVTVGAALLVLPSLTAQFDHRYVLVAIPFAAWSAALGLSMMARRAAPDRPAPPGPDREPAEPAGTGLPRASAEPAVRG